MKFDEMFEKATTEKPFPYQIRLAEADPWPDLLEAPTGSGKTEAVVLGWLWRKRFASPIIRSATPRRLVYCLPMRVLVEQTQERVEKWLSALSLSDDVGVYLLMGGETDNDWDLQPERDMVLIGTQDMLLSRTLNRGYALSRARWPLPFGLLNNDCLWIFDEVQLMGTGLATTTQLAAFRKRFKNWGPCPSLWISATLQPAWLESIDFRSCVPTLIHHELSKTEWRTDPLSVRLNATKILSKAKSTADEPRRLAEEILRAHQPDSLTLIVVNTVKKAVELYSALHALTRPAIKRGSKSPTLVTPVEPAPELLLLHSRFRPPQRTEKMKRLKQLAENGGIVISTQVVEAGVDISAQVLFTELSPWASFVQRVGRCNRFGEYKNARVFWMEVETEKKGAAAPYTPEALDASRIELKKQENVSPLALRDYLDQLTEARINNLYPYVPTNVIRQRTMEELFDTSADISGADLDISLYIRDLDDPDAQVYWRQWDGNDPNQPAPQSLPARTELCAAPLKHLRELQKDKRLSAFRWDFLESRWQRATSFIPGQVYLLPTDPGHYSSEIGWTMDETDPVQPIDVTVEFSEGNDRDPYSQACKIWQTIASHTDQVSDQMERILVELDSILSEKEKAALRHAARWHDWGKAYYVFQKALTTHANPGFPLPSGHLWAKSSQTSERYIHPGFRHELASALGMIALGHTNLSCYLVASHHGKVRLSIRSLPTEQPAPDKRRFARGVWEEDIMPTVQLGGGVVAPEVTLSLAPMELGLTDNQPSWTERALQLQKEYGPFRLAFLEAVLCSADRRASADPQPGGDV